MQVTSPPIAKERVIKKWNEWVEWSGVDPHGLSKWDDDPHSLVGGRQWTDVRGQDTSW